MFSFCSIRVKGAGKPKTGFPGRHPEAEPAERLATVGRAPPIGIAATWSLVDFGEKDLPRGAGPVAPRK
jgi:hypothetical protein